MKTIKVYDPKDFPSYLPKLNGLYDDLFADGKGFRSKLVQKIAAHLQLADPAVDLLCQTIEFIHNASLLHDDLIDRSHLRRNKPAAWLKYTPEYAVLAGDYLLARVMVNLSAHGNTRLIHYTSCVISDLLEGEWIQDSLVRDWEIRMEQLDRVHNLKTASLFKWCLRAPFLAKERYSDDLHILLEEIGTILGQLFQRSDDLLDFDIRNHEGKAILGDLKSGYLNSFGVFLLQRMSSERRAAFFKCTTMDGVRELVTSQLFDQYVLEFDQINQELIDLYHHQLRVLSQHLQASEQGLLKELEPLPQLLYWREKPQKIPSIVTARSQ